MGQFKTQSIMKNYANSVKPLSEIVRELTPELADKIFKSFQKKQYDDKVSKESVLHHLKQLKAQMGKERAKWKGFGLVQCAVDSCMEMIDKKIAKINQ